MGRDSKLTSSAALTLCLGLSLLAGCSEPPAKSKAEAEKEMFKPTDVSSLSPEVQAHLPKGGAPPPKGP